MIRPASPLPAPAAGRRPAARDRLALPRHRHRRGHARSEREQQQKDTTMSLGDPFSDPKAELQGYLQGARDALVWKLDGLSEYDIRRPMTPTGTNLLGLVKHCAGTELGYFGFVFGRPADEPTPWIDDDRGTERRHVGDRRRVARRHRELVPARMGALRRDDRRAAAGRDRRGVLVAGSAPASDVAPCPHPCDRRRATPRRTRRHRARTDRRCRGPAPARQQPARPRRRLVDHLPREARTRRSRSRTASSGTRRRQAPRRWPVRTWIRGVPAGFGW